MKKHLNTCIQIEETAAAIYRKMTKSTRLTATVRETLQELAADEDDHASQLRFALRFREGSIVTSLPKKQEQAHELLLHAKRILEKTLQQIEVDDQQAISIGVELEEQFCQIHIANSFEFKEDNFKGMFAAMAKEDERHCQRLSELKNSICRT